MYKYVVNHIPVLKGKRPGIITSMTSITIHNTGNPYSTAQEERNWLANSANTRAASFHIVVDSSQAIECIPLNEIAYHSGNSTGNLTSIGIEICESGNYKQNEDNAIDILAKILKERNWGVDKLKRHYDWSGKNCPRIIMPYWDDFKYKIYKKMGGRSMKPVVKLGSRGEIVKELQNALLKLGYSLGGYGADGSFGNATDKDVRQFQRDFGLSVDGSVGPATWRKLDELLASVGQPVTSGDDRYKNALMKIRNDINLILGE